MRKRLQCLLPLLVCLLAALAAAAPPSPLPAYRISKTYTTLEFTITKWMVFKEQGLFQDFSGTILYDPKRPEASSIDVTVQAASLDTRNSTRDGVLRSDDFFDVAKYPTLGFRSASVRSTGADSLEITGDLTIHGVTKRITIPVKMVGARDMPGIGSLVGFESEFTIDRRDFGVLGTRWSGGRIAIDNTVYLHLIIGGVRR